MWRRLGLLLCLLIAGVTVTYRSTTAQETNVCSGASFPSRLTINTFAVVTDAVITQSTTSLLMRETPSTSAPTITQLLPGTTVFIVNGPVCSEGGAWWNVQRTDTGLSGWVIEADNLGYFLEEVSADGQSIPAATPADSATREPKADDAPAASLPAKWTILVYMAADNNLEDFALSNMDVLEGFGTKSGEVNVLVQLDRSSGYNSEQGDWTEARRYAVNRPDLFAPNITTPYLEPLLGETDTSDPQTLIQFATWGIRNYPAERYALVLWGHGASWRGLAEDESSESKQLSLAQLDQALNAITTTTNTRFDVIGFDACLMGSLEVYNTLAPYADYAVASQELVPGTGWYYRGLMAAINADPNMDARTFGQTVVSTFESYYESLAEDFYTISLIDLGALPELNAALATFGASAEANPEALTELLLLRNQSLVFGGFDLPWVSDIWSSTDLFDFMLRVGVNSFAPSVRDAAQAIIAQRDQVVIAHIASQTLTRSSGVAIFFPRNAAVYEQAQERLLALPEHFQVWNQFLSVLFEQVNSQTVDWPVGRVTSVARQGQGVRFDLGLTSLNVSQLRFAITLNTPQTRNIVVSLTSRFSTEEGSSEAWDEQVAYIAQGEQLVPVLLLANPTNPNSASVSGILHPAEGDPYEAQLVFNISELTPETPIRPRRVWRLDATTGSASSVNLETLNGEFEPLWLRLDAEGQFFSQPSGTRFPVADFTLRIAQAPVGTYAVIVIAENISGNTTASSVNVQVDAAGVDVATTNAEIQRISDRDQDTIPDDVDNCPDVPNLLQEDADADRIGDVCDGELGSGPTFYSEEFGGSIEVNTSISGELTSGSAIQWEFNLTATRPLILEVEGDFDTTLTVLDSFGNVVAFNDDAPGSHNSRLEILLPPDTYFVRVGSYGNFSAGSYNLRIIQVGREANQVGSLSIGEYGFNILEPGITDQWELNVEQNATYSIYLFGTFNSVLNLVGSNGAVIETSTSDSDENILEIALQPGVYRVRIADSAGIGGSYELIVLAPTTAAASVPTNVGTLNVNETGSLSLPTSGIHLWTVEIRRTRTFTFELTGEFDTYLTLISANGVIIAQDDDSGDGTNSSITLELTPGRYTVQVSAYASWQSGAYDLTVRANRERDREGELRSEDVSGGVIGINQTRSGTLPIGTSADWQLTINNPQTITLDLIGEFDTILRLYDSSGNLLAENDDANGTLNSQLRINLVRGTYRVQVASFANAFGGGYTLQTTSTQTTTSGTGSVSSGSIGVGESRAGSLSAGSIQDWSLVLNGSQSLAINVNGEFDTYLRLLDANGRTIAENDDANGTLNSRIQINLAPGSYTIRISASGNRGSGIFTLEVRQQTAESNESRSALGVNDRRVGTLLLGTTQNWQLTVVANETIQIDLSGAFDTLLRLFDLNGTLIAENDDANGALGSQVIVSLAPGNYIISVSAFANSGSGSFELATTGLGNAPVMIPTPVVIVVPEPPVAQEGSPVASSIVVGAVDAAQLAESGFASYGGILQENTSHIWELNNDCRRAVRAEVYAINNNFTPVVGVVDDTNQYQSSRTASLEVLLEPGVTRFDVRSLDALGSGEYALLFFVNATSSSQQVELGSSLFISSVASTTRSYSFEVDIDQTVIIEVIGQSSHAYGIFDPIIELYDEFGMLVASNDDSQIINATDAKLELDLGAGRYTYVVREFSDCGGDYLMNLYGENGLEATDEPRPSIAVAEPTVPTPPPAPLCYDLNFEGGAVVRADADLDRDIVNCRVLVENGRYLTWYGGPLTFPANVGVDWLVQLPILNAVDVFTGPGGGVFNGDVVICLRGAGSLYFLNANQSPRIPVEITAWSSSAFPGFTCGTLYEPGTLVLVEGDATTLLATDEPPSGTLQDCRIVTTYAVRLRAQPNTESEILGTLPYEAVMTAFNYDNGWYNVQYGDQIGWVSAEHVRTLDACTADG